jgi:hypothetical protein
MRLSPTLALSMFTAVALVAISWGYQQAKVVALQAQVDALRQSCVSRDVYQADMRWYEMVAEGGKVTKK